MKKRLFKATICIFAAIITAFSASCGGSDLSKASGVKKAYESSMQSVRTVVTTAEYKDGAFVIKTVKKTQAFISDTEASVITETTAIDPSTFEQSVKTETNVVNLDRKDLIVFNFKSKILDNFSSDGGTVSVFVSDENVAEFIGELPSFGGITFSAEFDGGKIKSANYSFKFITDEIAGKVCEAFVTTVYSY